MKPLTRVTVHKTGLGHRHQTYIKIELVIVAGHRFILDVGGPLRTLAAK
jgi:hypothetical protein